MSDSEKSTVCTLCHRPIGHGEVRDIFGECLGCQLFGGVDGGDGVADAGDERTLEKAEVTEDQDEKKPKLMTKARGQPKKGIAQTIKTLEPKAREESVSPEDYDRAREADKEVAEGIRRRAAANIR